MQKKLTITLDERVDAGLHSVVGRRRMSRFIETLVRPHVIGKDLDAAYKQMALDDQRKAESQEWMEATECRSCRLQPALNDMKGVEKAVKVQLGLD
jgi:hypothetical protein